MSVGAAAFAAGAKRWLVFAELPIEQRLDGLECVLGVRAFGPDIEMRTGFTSDLPATKTQAVLINRC